MNNELLFSKNKISTDEQPTDKLVDVLKSLGMIPLQSGLFKFNNVEKSSKKIVIKTFHYEILLNGCVLGYVDSNEIDDLILKLRYLKALASTSNEANQNELAKGLPKYMEICHVPKIDFNSNTYSLYPGLYLFTNPGRMMRPVKNLSTNDIEYIGTMEQCYLHICVKPEEFVETVNFDYLF